MGVFVDGKRKINILSIKRGPNVDETKKQKETPPKGCFRTSIDLIRLIRRISAASSASARCSENIEAAGTPDPNKVRGRHAPNRGCLSEVKTGVKIALKRKCSAFSRALFFSSDCFELFVQSCRNVNRTSNCTTNHWVVTDSEESHHLNVCWN